MSENFHENENQPQEEIIITDENGNEEVNIYENPEHPVLVTNTSGRGIGASVPEPVGNKFNWGACFLTFVWGICNNSPITLIFIVFLFITALSFIKITPFTILMILIDLIVMTCFGYKGNTWAWKYKRFPSIAEFHEIQKKWAIGSLIFIVLCGAIFAPQVANFFIKFNEIFAGTHI